MLWRGVRRRCAYCGGRGAFFTGWFAKQERCKTCGIGWHRGYEGFELGAMAISAIVVFGTLIVAVGIGVVATLPDVAVRPAAPHPRGGGDRAADPRLPGELHGVAGRGPGDAPADAEDDVSSA